MLGLLTGCSTPQPPVITSLWARSIAGGVSYRWNITYAANVTLTCTLDANGDGVTDATLTNCENVNSYDYLFATPGRYLSKVTVTDSHGRSGSATVTTVAAGTSATPATWTRQFGSSADDFAYGATTDVNGDTILAGETYGALPGHSSAGQEDIALAKYDAQGTQLWATQYGGTSYDSANGVTSDGSGAITVVGTTGGALPGHTNLGQSDIMLVKFDTQGHVLWSRQLGTSSLDYGNGITIDGQGDTTIVGDTYGALPGHTNAGGADIVLAKYDADGNPLWITQFGTSKSDFAFGITSDANGNTTIVGTTDGALPGHTSAGAADILVAKYDPDGHQLWATQFGTSAEDDGWGITSDANGNSLLVGYTGGALTHAGAGGLDIVVAKIDPSGTLAWTAQFGTSGDDEGVGITSDVAGNATVVGFVAGALPGHTSAGGSDIVVAKYDRLGKQVWTRQFGTTGDDEGDAITSDANGNTTVVGGVAGALPGASSAGGYDIPVASFVP